MREDASGRGLPLGAHPPAPEQQQHTRRHSWDICVQFESGTSIDSYIAVPSSKDCCALFGLNNPVPSDLDKVQDRTTQPMNQQKHHLPLRLR
ncbi:hypothetical protein J6590_013984 [Homalodisca vitripennis]|nr:hypothetical protein J6590_013984 [Homalodisca vitripennis]